MSRARLGQITLTGRLGYKAALSKLSITGSAQGKARLRQLTLTGSASNAKARIRQLSLTGSEPSKRALLRELKLIGSAAGSLVAKAGGGQNVEPYSVVTLDGSASTGLPDSYAWVQVSNGAPTVTLIGSGAVVGFVAPPAATGCDVVLRLTVTKGASTATDLATISVYPHLLWYLAADKTTWLPGRNYHIF